MSEAPPPAARPPRGRFRLAALARSALLHFLLPLLVLYGAWAGLRFLLATAPTTQRVARPRLARAVEVVVVEPGEHRPLVEAMGTVRAARETWVRAAVSGPVLSRGRGVEPGGVLAAGATILTVDPAAADLALAEAEAALAAAGAAAKEAQAEFGQARAGVAQRQTALARAEAELRLEEGRRAVAQRELESLGRPPEQIDSELVLRVPQHAIALAEVAAGRAGVEAAEAGVALAEARVLAAAARETAATHVRNRAQLEVDRAVLVAPFDCWVRDRRVDQGSYVTPSTDVAWLIGTGAYWVEALVPARDLIWLRFPEPGSPAPAGADGGPDGPAAAGTVRVRHEGAWPEGAWRSGRIVRLLGDLDPVGRMARVLVEVVDPLDLGAPAGGPRRPLLLDSFVRVEAQGAPVGGVVRLDRRLLRHGDVLWIADAAEQLRFVPVEVVFRGQETVLVRGAGLAGARVVATDLGTPVEGMALRIRGAGP